MHILRLCHVMIILLVGGVTAVAQVNVTTFGIQYKPIIPSRMFDTGPEVVTNEQFVLTKTPLLGYNFGMVIRQGFTDRFSLEMGINYTRRNFSLEFNDDIDRVNEELIYVFTAYEIPIQGLLYVRLGEQLWMNAAGGFSFDMYPSDLYSLKSQDANGLIYDFEQRTLRNSWVQISLIANYGFEWRTKSDGYFYLGASYHRPFSEMAVTEATYYRDNFPYRQKVGLNGSYLTLDLRYFFHEDPQRKKKVKKSDKDEKRN